MHQPRICICICVLASFLMTSDCKSDSLMCINGRVVYLSNLGEGEDSSSSETTTLTPSSAVSCVSVVMVTVTSSCLLTDAGSDSPRQRGRTGLLLIYNTHTHIIIVWTLIIVWNEINVSKPKWEVIFHMNVRNF